MSARRGFLLIISCCICTICCEITCLDHRGRSVDWFIAYKPPIITDHPDPLIKSGKIYFYLDVHSPKWLLSSIPITEPRQAISNTLQQIYKNNGSHSVAYYLYNDQKPGDFYFSGNHGHTKGSACLDKTSGFWLIHSVPNFPPRAHLGYSYPEGQAKNGQTFLCVSFLFNDFNAIGKQMLYNYPKIYDKNLPPVFLKDLPSLASALRGERIKQPPWNSSVTLRSRQGQQFTIFSKASKFADDLYHAWVAPYLESDLYTETWQLGEGGRMPSDCSGSFKVKNVAGISFQDPKVFFKSTKDHSKWAVTTDKGKYWVCIGDINRMKSQCKRGGGTVCLQQQKVWSAFKDIISKTENCKLPPKYNLPNQ